MATLNQEEHYLLKCEFKPLEVADYAVEVVGEPLPAIANLPESSMKVLVNPGVHKAGIVPVVNDQVTIDSQDVSLVWGAMRALRHHISHGSLEHMVRILQDDAEKSFDDFKEAIKPHGRADDTQYLIAKDLNDIEARTSDYPLTSAKHAAVLYGEMNSANPSRLVAKLKKEFKILGFYFGNSRNIQIPIFQFDTDSLGVYETVPKLCRIFDDLNDWGVYKWLTSFDEDLECTPAQAIRRPELEDDLLYLAGLFKSASTLRELSFVAEGNGNE
ncbi:hypothetical protein VIBNIFTn2_120106 [Vibrio nigripulchritudo FTn2]|uniref:hypothetical protein n=1 Tax=Vibrio nigripulchritudo TaxID=28173 RepID=UPI0003B20EA2|nr:hypothetical protein [Vibrio nigripulchritudo]CCN40124.1 hypothetical protein VIBNIFTn2_120106 [Vibrio nigripulchritudo FTn2]